MNEADKTLYNKKRGHVEKEQFRAQWEIDNADLVAAASRKRRKSSVTSDTNSEVSEGWCHPRPVIIREEGGHEFEENIIAADKYIAKCLRRGGAWVLYNPATERLAFLYM